LIYNDKGEILQNRRERRWRKEWMDGVIVKLSNDGNWEESGMDQCPMESPS
jgi:hypothetical protein